MVTNKYISNIQYATIRIVYTIAKTSGTIYVTESVVGVISTRIAEKLLDTHFLLAVTPSHCIKYLSSESRTAIDAIIGELQISSRWNPINQTYAFIRTAGDVGRSIAQIRSAGQLTIDVSTLDNLLKNSKLLLIFLKRV